MQGSMEGAGVPYSRSPLLYTKLGPPVDVVPGRSAAGSRLATVAGGDGLE